MVAGGVGGAGPLALAAGAQERRRLKQGAKQPGPPTDLDNHMFTNFGTHISTNLDVHILSGEEAAEVAGAAGCEPGVGSGVRGAAVAPQHLPQRQLAGASLEEAQAQLQLDGGPQRWQRGPQLAFPVVAALKDLGSLKAEGGQGRSCRQEGPRSPSTA